MSSRPFEERVLAELGALNRRLTTIEDRLTTLDDKVDTRLRETRPLWEAVEARLTKMENTLNDMNLRLRQIAVDHLDMRARVSNLEERRSPIA